ncbi:aspartate-semialdehyde dehydrogenase [candidate division NPL-UPA2 bacterium]|nr:aspartate-semialdehyde dehydrogenase [candidate division NPL-UPA2 bacterium]
MKKFNVAVVGIGIVGTEMLRILRERNFPARDIKVLATRSRIEEIEGCRYQVEPTTVESFEGVDIAFFAGSEGAKGASRQFGWPAVEKGAIVIDNGDDYRLDPRVPLVIPEVNADHLKKHQGFISSPNCSTIQLVMALAPLHRQIRIKRIIVSTYQSVSGTGRAAIKELKAQTRAIGEREEVRRELYPHRIAFNLFPEIGGLVDEFPGYYREEVKTAKETRKLLDEPQLSISATCVRVPVFIGHSEAVNVQFEKELSVREAREILKTSPGLKVLDDPGESLYPTPFEIAGKDEVYVGRIRKDLSAPHCLNLWIVGDNIRKGAALNTIQIAEEIIRQGIENQKH